MFAPWCPTCRRRTLLGPRRVVAIERRAGGVRARLRCFCGTDVWSTDEPPAAPVGNPAALEGDLRPAVGWRG